MRLLQGAARRGHVRDGRAELPERRRAQRGLRAYVRRPRHVGLHARDRAVTAPSRTAGKRGFAYKMKDLVVASGLPRQAIHFYVKEGLLPPGKKTGRNTALYSEEHLTRLALIKKLKHERFLPLKAIKAVLDGRESGFTP